MKLHMQRLFAAAAAAVLVCAASSAGQEAGGAQSLDFPHAGISLTLPEGYASNAPDGPALLYATRGIAEGRPRSITLSVIPAGENIAVESGCDELVESLRGNPAFRQFQVVERGQRKVADLPARTATMSYVCRGDSCTAAVGLWMRELPGKKGKLGYVLSVEMLEADKDSLLPTFDAVAESVLLTDLEHPAALPLGPLGQAVEDLKLGYSLRVPRGWSVARRYGGVVLAQPDCLDGGEWTFTAAVQVAEAPADTEPEAFLKKGLAARRIPGVKNSILSSAPAALAGLKGHQIIFQPVAEREEPGATTRPETQPAPERPEVFIVHRVACGPPGGDSRKVYSLILIGRGIDAEKAGEIMSTLASGFSLIKTARPGPETKPAEN